MLMCDAQTEKLSNLLRRVGAGDGPAFGELHTISARRLLPYATRIVRSKDLADEVLQESFVAIWRDARKFDNTRAAPMTWMITIVRHKAIDCLRANAQRERLTDHDRADAQDACRDPAAGPCELVELVQRARLLHDGLTTLPALPRRAIELAFFQDLTHDQVALTMIIPLGTVKTWIRRGCRQIRRHIEGPIIVEQYRAASLARLAGALATVPAPPCTN